MKNIESIIKAAQDAGHSLQELLQKIAEAAETEKSNQSQEKPEELRDHFLGYMVRNTWNSDGYVLISPTPKRHHLGNYRSLEDAQRAGVMHYLIARQEFASLVASYALYGRGHCHEFDNLD